MPGADFHSRMVGWLKVALPLAALALLSTLFLVADRIDPDAALPYAEVDVEDLARDPRMLAPTYAGTTRDGAGITVSAAVARPAGETAPAGADQVVARIETPDGGVIDMTAATLLLTDETRTVMLAGGVTVRTGTGYTITTEGLTAQLDRTAVEGQGPVTVTSPMGRIDARGFALTQGADDASAYLLVFKGGVKLVYQPGG